MPQSLIKILLLENDPVDMMAFIRYVEKNNLPYKVDTAVSIQEALERISATTFDVILLDYHLNDGTGLEALSAIKETPAIFITGSGNEQVAVEALKNGAADYIIKDIDRNYLALIPSTIANALKLKENEKKLAVYALELERSNKELESFAHVASHDLKEPLRRISSFGELLKSKASEYMPDEHKTYLDKIIRSADRMAQLIDDLLKLSRVSTKKHPYESVNLNELVSEVITALEERVTRSMGNIKIGELPTIEAVPFQMRQLFQNIISNGLKYHRDNVEPVIKINSQPIDNNMWAIEVADNGIGIDSKYVEKIFAPFERLHNKNEYEGTGIGLAICQKIVTQHSGSIHLESQVGQGSKFIITLPAKQPTE